MDSVCPQGETPLHFACEAGLTELVKVLLDKGANPNSQTFTASMSALESNLVALGVSGEESRPVSRQTPLHLALTRTHDDVVQVFLKYKGGPQTRSVAVWVFLKSNGR